jgi:predicted transcriptional regulator
VLGELERAVLDRLWSAGASDVRAMHDALGEARGIRANTIQSTLERLHRKGLARRWKQGRAYVYEASLTRREWLANAMEELVRTVPGAEPETVVSAFVDLVERTGEAQLAALEKRVREKRRGSGDS